MLQLRSCTPILQRSKMQKSVRWLCNILSVASTDKVGVFYSDNAKELTKASKSLGWRHEHSKDCIHQSNAIAERAVRAMSEGTRCNLLQAGLSHVYRPQVSVVFLLLCDPSKPFCVGTEGCKISKTGLRAPYCTHSRLYPKIRFLTHP